jgi:signal recognition particle subunit SRP54
MGGVSKILDMMPGISAQQKKGVDLEASEREFAQMEAIIQSMTKEERNDPTILNASRRKRISRGCGQPVSKVNNLIRRYEDTRKMMRQLTDPKKMKRNRFLRGLMQ